MMRSCWIVGPFVCGVLALGCGGSETGPAKAPTASVSSATARAPLTPKQDQALEQAQEQVGGTGLGIDDAILRLCPEVRPPQFDFDSAKVKQQFRDALSGLATCMTRGNLQGKDVLLIGHADPRGEEDYNMALGGRRAESVRTALQSLGVEQRHLDVSSRGAQDAKGTDETTWSKDRRVDIKLKVN
jgi:peptidoglycan-associated lipoprotein